MSQQISDQAREEVMKAAFESGFSRLDMLSPDITIARIVAEIWAAPEAASCAPDTVSATDIVIAALRYNTGHHHTPEMLSHGIRRLAEPVRKSGSAEPLDRIARLLCLFVRHMRTRQGGLVPEDRIAGAALAAADLSRAAQAIRSGDDANRDSDQEIRALAWLDAELAGLWS